MIELGELHFRVLYVLVAVGVLGFLRKPFRNRDAPESPWFALAIGSVSVWLAGVGLYYVARDLGTALALYNVVLFSITLCFSSWLLIAIAFATGRRPPRWLLAGLGVFAIAHLLVLWTNYVWLHELVYTARGRSTYVDAGGGLNTGRGPAFWVHMAVVYAFVLAATLVFLAEMLTSSGLRRRQAGLLALTPAVGVVASVLWFAEVLRLPFDPTPFGVTVGIVLVGWALYRTDFLAITTVATRTVFEEMPDAVVIFDALGSVVEWNLAATRYFDVADPQVGMPATSFFEQVPAEVRSALVGADRSNTQVSFTVQGRTRECSVSKFPLESDRSNSTGHVVVLRDISELQRRHRQLLEQNERLESFTDIVSHDLQGPLMRIRASADESIATGDVTPVEQILDSTDRIDTLVTDLLRVARSGQQLDVNEPVAVPEVARTAWSNVWSPSATLTIETDLTVVGDPTRIQQLFENLFRNGVDHGRAPASDRSATQSNTVSPVRTPSATASRPSTDALPEDSAVGVPTPSGPSEHTVQASSPDGDVSNPDVSTSEPSPPATVRITVGSMPGGFYIADDGPGILPAMRERVFEKGYTGSAAGTGIGLSIVQQIVDAHGWSVRITESRWGGARVEITDVTVADADDGVTE